MTIWDRLAMLPGFLILLVAVWIGLRYPSWADRNLGLFYLAVVGGGLLSLFGGLRGPIGRWKRRQAEAKAKERDILRRQREADSILENWAKK